MSSAQVWYLLIAGTVLVVFAVLVLIAVKGGDGRGEAPRKTLSGDRVPDYPWPGPRA